MNSRDLLALKGRTVKWGGYCSSPVKMGLVTQVFSRLVTPDGGQLVDYVLIDLDNRGTTQRLLPATSVELVNPEQEPEDEPGDEDDEDYD